MAGFALDEEKVALPTGAFARTRRRMLLLDGRPVLGLTAGIFRPYFFPVYTPAGFPVTAEGPADHPHHHSLWVGADHVHLVMPAFDRTETYAYNCYVNDIFQGRAPGRILEVAMHGEAEGGAFRIEQSLEWRGPIEWGAPEGRLLMRETRTTRVAVTAGAYVIDQRSRLAAADQDVVVGPTRHAWFNFRVAPSMCVEAGGVLYDERGVGGPADALDPAARWVGASGPVGGGHRAGIALAPHADGRRWWWYASDWGVVTASPCRDAAMTLDRETTATLAARYVVHDGVVEPQRLAEMFGDV